MSLSSCCSKSGHEGKKELLHLKSEMTVLIQCLQMCSREHEFGDWFSQGLYTGGCCSITMCIFIIWGIFSETQMNIHLKGSICNWHICCTICNPVVQVILPDINLILNDCKILPNQASIKWWENLCLTLKNKRRSEEDIKECLKPLCLYKSCLFYPKDQPHLSSWETLIYASASISITNPTVMPPSTFKLGWNCLWCFCDFEL